MHTYMPSVSGKKDGRTAQVPDLGEGDRRATVATAVCSRASIIRHARRVFQPPPWFSTWSFQLIPPPSSTMSAAMDVDSERKPRFEVKKVSH